MPAPILGPDGNLRRHAGTAIAVGLAAGPPGSAPDATAIAPAAGVPEVAAN